MWSPVGSSSTAKSPASSSGRSASSPSCRLTDGTATSDAVSTRRSSAGAAMRSGSDAVLTQDLVQLRLVGALPRLEAAQDQGAREPELAAGELALAGRLYDDAPGRHDAASDLLAGLRVDHRDGGVEDDALADPAALTDTRALGDHGAAADHRVVLDDDRRRLRRLEDTTDADAAGQVPALADLPARADRRPRIDHRVSADTGADVHVR